MGDLPTTAPSAGPVEPVKNKGGRPKGSKTKRPEMDPEQRARLSEVSINPNPAAPPPPPPLQPVAPKKPTRPVEYENLGRMAAGYWFGVGETLLGEDWKPNGTEEKQIPEAFTAYFRANEIGDIPPGVALCLALGVYTVTRVNKPSIRERFAHMRLSFAQRVAKWRGKK